MIKKHRYNKVKPVGTSSLIFSFDRAKETLEAKFTAPSQTGRYYFYNLKELFRKLKPNLLGIIAVLISVVGIVIIDQRFKPIQTTIEIIGKQENLINMCALIFIIILWNANIKANKVAIFR